MHNYKTAAYCQIHTGEHRIRKREGRKNRGKAGWNEEHAKYHRLLLSVNESAYATHRDLHCGLVRQVRVERSVVQAAPHICRGGRRRLHAERR